MQVTIGFNEETLSAITTLSSSLTLLAAAGRGASGATETLGKTADAATGDDNETIYWADNSTGEFGKVESAAEYKALKKKAPGTVKITETMYDAKVENAEKAEAAAKKDAAKSTKSAKADTKKSTTKVTESSDDEPTIEDVIAAFSAYLPRDLDKDERAERAAFVKPMLARFGAAKATELAEEHRALAINLVQRKMAGEDVDPETDEFAEVDESLV